MSLLSTLRDAVQQNRNYPTESLLDPETACDVLRRRCILAYMAEQGTEAVPAGDIADYLATFHDDDRTAAYVAAIQSHLPMMDEAGVCRYDKDRKLVELTARGREVIEVHQSVVEQLG